jgi:CHAT domain-containing protein/tetratricopeptide (TPR) repeat protein
MTMDPKWLLTMVLGVIVALGFCQVARADQAQMSRLALAGKRAYDAANFPQALAKWEQGLKLAKKSGDQPAVADFLGNLGLVYDALGQYDRALEYLRQALAMHRELKDSRGEAQDLNNQGVVYRHLNQYEQALEHHRQALNLFREIKDRRGEGSATGHLGLISWFMGQYDRSLEYNQAALAIHRETKDRRGEGQVLGNLGVEYYRLGQYDQAIEYHRQALAIHRELKDPRFQGNELINLGEVYRDLGQYKEALECFRQALGLHRQTKSRRGEGQALTALGLASYDSGQYKQALKYHQQALIIHRETKNRLDEAGDLTSLGLVYDNLGQPEQALKTLQEAVKLCREVGQPENLWRAQRALGKVEANQGRDDAAIQNYRQALDGIEGLRAGLGSKESKSTYMKNKLFVYDELIELLRARHEKDPTKGYDRDALEIFERKQGRLFLEEMGQSGARNFAGLPEQVKSQETELENRLDTLQAALVKERSQPQPDQARLQALETELHQARGAFQTLKGEIQTRYPDYYALKYPQPAKLAELQTKVLKPGEVMLIYGVLKDKTCLWVISKEVCRLETLPVGEKDLSRKVAACRRAVLKPGEGTGNAAGVQDPACRDRDQLRHELYRLLFPDPVRSALSPGNLLYIIPTGPLYFLPFEALETQAPDQPLHYLVEDYAVAYLSSASLLKTLREAQARKQSRAAHPLIAFANPSYETSPGSQTDDKSVRGLQTRAYREIMGGTFPELPETEEEVRAIKELLKAPDHSQPLLVKDAASRSTIFSLNQDARLSAYRYLVFACHGILPGEVDRVLQPALVLAHPEKDGYLTMGDVFGLKLNAELVSLSACNTGSGTRIRGEGVVGLTRSFMYAGTPAVAVTLWSVESNSAKELNVGMYRYLSQKHGRAAALREIKLALLRGERGNEYRDPFFWAPLVVFGDGQ